ncbi:CAP domain-containing protein [Nocardioides sp. CCNWLW239]|uniref:CAP domain-containing protein n=1 Tax=Nocardioides sp. CCNWLW239 TaxID=3128902 RepID=UPI003017958B
MFPHLHRLVPCLLALLLAAAALLVGAGPASAGEGGSIKRLANAARSEAGLDPLTRDSALDGLARRWAYKIAADGSLSHNPDLAEQVPQGWQGVGENVAMGYPTGAEMHRGWMNSEGHRANILGDYTHIGIAFVVVDGTSWGVQVFAKYPPGARPTEKPKATPAPAPPASTKAPTPRQTAKPTKPATTETASPTPSRTSSALPSVSPSGSASASESTSSLAGGDSETAGPVTFTDASDGPTPASSGLFGIGVAEVAVGMLGLSALGLLAGLFLGRHRRDRRRRETVTEQARPGGTHPARTHPAPNSPLSNYPARTYPARTFPAQAYPAQSRPVRPSPPPRREW